MREDTNIVASVNREMGSYEIFEGFEFIRDGCMMRLYARTDSGLYKVCHYGSDFMYGKCLFDCGDLLLIRYQGYAGVTLRKVLRDGTIYYPWVEGR